MVSIFFSSVVDRGFELRLGRQTKYSKLGSCCFSTKNAALRRNSKEYANHYTTDAVSSVYDVLLVVVNF
jgi:hypothetical protein